MDNCPSCLRAFEGIADFPRIKVDKVERWELPSDVKFPTQDREIYAGPKSGLGNPRPPQEVLDYFRNNSGAKNFTHQGWIWAKEENWSAKKGDTPSGDVAHYRRSMDDARELILEHLNPYLEGLEKLVGKEVDVGAVFPTFSEGSYSNFLIPETGYTLSLDELDEYRQSYYEQEGLRLPSVDKSKNLRYALLAITHSSGGSISVVHYLGVIGAIAYEGKLAK